MTSLAKIYQSIFAPLRLRIKELTRPPAVAKVPPDELAGYVVEDHVPARSFGADFQQLACDPA